MRSQLDVVVDDRPDNCLDVVLESKAGAVLVWRGPQSTVPSSAKRLGIAVVSTVGACLDALVQAQESDAEGGVIDRLRRLFGLRTAFGVATASVAGCLKYFTRPARPSCDDRHPKQNCVVRRLTSSCHSC